MLSFPFLRSPCSDLPHLLPGLPVRLKLSPFHLPPCGQGDLPMSPLSRWLLTALSTIQTTCSHAAPHKALSKRLSSILANTQTACTSLNPRSCIRPPGGCSCCSLCLKPFLSSNRPDILYSTPRASVQAPTLRKRSRSLPHLHCPQFTKLSWHPAGLQCHYEYA